MNNYQLIEIGLILIIIIIQIYKFYKYLIEIEDLQNLITNNRTTTNEFLFNNDDLITYSPDEIIKNIDTLTFKDEIISPKIKKIKLITTVETNRYVMNSINREVNLYLLSKKGSFFDFEYIRNIAESHISSEEDSITASINNPLYLGLMATLIGIIIGLGSLFLSGSEALEDSNISTFLFNIGIAMISSFLGVSLTTILNNRFKKGKKKLDYNKIRFLNQLFIDLSPENDTEDTGSILNSLKDNFLYFNLEMEKNVQSFSTTVSELKNFLSYNIQENLNKQSEILNKFYELNIPYILDTNLKVMNEFTQSTSNLDRFNNYLDNINNFIHSSNRLTDQSEKLFEEVKKFGSTIETNLKNVETNLNVSNSLLNFLESHTSELHDRNDGIKALVNRIDSNIEKGIGKLDEKILKEKETIRETADEIDSTIRDTLINLKKYTSESIRELQINLKQEEQKVRSLLKDSNGNLAQLAYLGKIHDEIQNTKTLEAIYLIQNEHKIIQSEVLKEIKRLNVKSNSEANMSVLHQEMITLLKEIRDQNSTINKYQTMKSIDIFRKISKFVSSFFSRDEITTISQQKNTSQVNISIENNESFSEAIAASVSETWEVAKTYSNMCDQNGFLLCITSEKMQDSIFEIQINESNEGHLTLLNENISIEKSIEQLYNACIIIGKNKKNPKKLQVKEMGSVILEDGRWKIINKIKVKLL